MAPEKEIVIYVEVKPDNFAMKGDIANQYKTALRQVMAAEAIKNLKDPLVTKLPPGTKTGLSMSGTLEIKKADNGTWAEASLQFNNWPQDSLFVMGTAKTAPIKDDDTEGLAKDLAKGVVKDFITKRLMPKVNERVEKEKKEQGKK